MFGTLIRRVHQERTQPRKWPGSPSFLLPVSCRRHLCAVRIRDDWLAAMSGAQCGRLCIFSALCEPLLLDSIPRTATRRLLPDPPCPVIEPSTDATDTTDIARACLTIYLPDPRPSKARRHAATTSGPPGLPNRLDLPLRGGTHGRDGDVGRRTRQPTSKTGRS